MTDNEIIKALECCPQGNSNHNCSKCNYRSDDIGYCFENLMKDALDLINRQQAEIERLNEEVDRLSQCVLYHEGHIADAIKEFADKLKEQDGYNNHVFDDCASILVPEEYLKGRDEKIKEVWNTIDSLVKEMVGAE